jgi:hypothetical protein
VRRARILASLAFVILLPALAAQARAQGSAYAVIDRPQVETVVSEPGRTVVQVRFPVQTAPADWATVTDIDWQGISNEHWLLATEELLRTDPEHTVLVAVGDAAAAPRWQVLQTSWHHRPTGPARPVSVGEPRLYRGVPLAPVKVRPAASGGVLAAVVVQIEHPAAARAKATGLGRAATRRVAAEPLPGRVTNPDVFRSLRQAAVSAALRAEPAGEKAPLPEYFALTDRWVRLYVEGEAVFAVSGEELEAMGVPLAGVDPQKLRLYKGGGLTLRANPEVAPEDQPLRAGLNEVAIAVQDGGDGEFNLDDRILFFGLGTDIWRDRLQSGAERLDFYNHPHQDRGIYWLTWDDHGSASPLPGEPKRVPTVDRPAAGGELVTRYRGRYHGEENRVWAGGYVRDNWVWDRAVIASFSRTFTLEGVVSEEPAEWNLDLCGIWGGSSLAQMEGEIWLNDNTGAAVPFDFEVQAIEDQERLRYSGSSTSLTSGANTIRLRYDNYSEAQSLLAVDSFDIQYTATLDKRQYAGALACILWGDDVPAPNTPYDVRFTHGGGTPWLWDVSEADSAIALAGTTDGGDPATLTVGLLRQPGPDRHLVLFDPDTDPRGILGGERAQVTPLQQTVPSADYLVIHAEEFADAAAELVALRSRTLPGVSDPAAAAVSTRDIYDNFSGGQKDWRAIRNFLRWHWDAHGQRLRWVCLLGDASRDYRNFLDHDPRTELVDRVPTAVVTEFPPVYVPYPLSVRSPFVADDLLVSLDDPYADPDGIGVDIPDLGVGRLPATSAEDARQLVDRVVRFVEDPPPGLWRNEVVWAADDLRYRGMNPRPTEVKHTVQAENLAHNFLPPALDIEKVYLLDYPLVGNTRPAARRDLLAKLSEGTTIFYYVGHGAANVLADEQLFRIDDVAGLTNGDRRFMFMAFSCDVWVFDDPNTQCMAEDFLGSSQGGGIAAVAASWVSLISHNDNLSDSFTAALYPDRSVDPTATLSEALIAAKVDNWFSVIRPDQPSPSAVRNNRRYNLLGDPALTLGHPVDDLAFTGATTDSLLTGRVHQAALDLAAGDLQPGSGVTYQLRVQESATDELYLELDDGRSYSWRRLGGTAFRGTGTLEQDQQPIRFRAPASLRTGQAGRLRVVVDDGDQLASAVLRLPVVQVAAGSGGDVVGPDIRIGFASGGTRVRTGDPLTAVLSDTSGINILASNPASSVLLEFDRSGIYNDVSADVAFAPGSYTEATLETSLPPDLALGEHTVVMTASDMFGNVGSDTLGFTLETASVAQLRDVTVFPNPTPGPCRLVCDVSGPMDVQWDIYTVSGRRVRSLRASFAAAGPGVLHWDGRDGEGDQIANGTYLYVLRGTPVGQEHEIRQTGQLVIMQ